MSQDDPSALSVDFKYRPLRGCVDTLIEEDVIPVGEGDRHVRVWTIRNEASSTGRGCIKITVSTIPIISTGFHSSAARRLR